MDLSSLTISIPTTISLVGLVIACATYFGNKKRQTKVDTKEAVNESNQQVALLTSIDTRLGVIEKNTELQAKHLEKHDDEIHNLDNRVVALESSKPNRKRG